MAHTAWIGLVVFGCTFSAALGAMKLRAGLPEHHLSDASKETVRLGVGLIATMTALLLGLVTASAKSAFDTMYTTVRQSAVDVIALDRLLARYGPETAQIRAGLKLVVADRADAIRSDRRSQGAAFEPSQALRQAELLEAQITGLVPQTNEQRWLQSRAQFLSEKLLEARWLVSRDLGTPIPGTFLVILLSWLMITFASFGLFAPRNATAVVVLLLCAASVACAIFLILEMDRPLEGLVRVSTEPLEYALTYLNQ